MSKRPTHHCICTHNPLVNKSKRQIPRLVVTQWPYNILPRITSWCGLVSLASMIFSLLEALIQQVIYGLLHHLHPWVPCARAKRIVVVSSRAHDRWWIIGTNGCSIGNLVRVHVAYDVAQCRQPALQLHHLGAQHRVLSFCCCVVLGGDVQRCDELLFRRPQLVDLFRMKQHSCLTEIIDRTKSLRLSCDYWQSWILFFGYIRGTVIGSTAVLLDHDEICIVCLSSVW